MAVENRNNSVDTSNISSTSNIVDKEEASKRIKKHHSSRFTRVLRSGLTINTMAEKEASKQKLKSPESRQSYTSLGSTSPKIVIQERTKKSTEQLEEIAREVGYKRNSSVSAKENGLATCELIKRDRDGKPILPQQIGVMTVCNLGQAKTKPDTFHTRNYIYPVGYTIQRMMDSMVQPGVKTLYTFTLEDGGGTPIFKITCADNPTKPMTSKYCAPAVRELFTKAERATSPSRQRMLPLLRWLVVWINNSMIVSLLQELPGVDKLRNYSWRDFKKPSPKQVKRLAFLYEKKSTIFASVIHQLQQMLMEGILIRVMVLQI